MNDAHIADELLQRYADGDLPSSRAAGVAEHMKRCAQCQSAHDELLALHRVFAVAAEESARGVDFEALYARIERGTREAPSPSVLERLAVWWRDLIEQRPDRLYLPAAAGALAVVALVVVSTRDVAQTPGETSVSVQVPAGQPPAELPANEPKDALALTGAGSEVVQVDFGDGTGTVYEIALADGTSTPVVWINDEE